MVRSPSLRWMRAGVRVLATGAVMFAAGMATNFAAGPEILFVIFMTLMVAFGLIGFVLVCIGGTKLRAETRGYQPTQLPWLAPPQNTAPNDEL